MAAATAFTSAPPPAPAVNEDVPPHLPGGGDTAGSQERGRRSAAAFRGVALFTEAAARLDRTSVRLPEPKVNKKSSAAGPCADAPTREATFSRTVSITPPRYASL